MRKLLAAAAFLIGSGSMAQAATCGFGDSINESVHTALGTGVISSYTHPVDGSCSASTIPFTLSGPALIAIALDYGFAPPTGFTYSVTLDTGAVGPTPSEQLTESDDGYVYFTLEVLGGTHLLGITINYAGTAIEDTAFTLGLSVVNYVPEPATMAVLGAGILGLGFARRRRT